MAYIPSETHFCLPSEEFETIVVDYVVLDRTSIGFNRVLGLRLKVGRHLCSVFSEFTFQLSRIMM